MMFTLNCVRAWCFYCSINWAVRKSMSSIQALFLSILHLLSPANVHNLILGTLCILLLQLFCQKVELAIISKPSCILLLCFLFIYTDFSWVKFDWFVVFWHTFHHLPVKALGPTNTPWINPRGWRPFREKQINLPWFCQNLWNVTCFIYFAKWVVSRSFSCLLHVCLLFVNCVMLLLCVPASDRSSYFRLFIVSWCQLMSAYVSCLVGTCLNDLELFWQRWISYDIMLSSLIENAIINAIYHAGHRVFPSCFCEPEAWQWIEINIKSDLWLASVEYLELSESIQGHFWSILKYFEGFFSYVSPLVDNLTKLMSKIFWTCEGTIRQCQKFLKMYCYFSVLNSVTFCLNHICVML